MFNWLFARVTVLIAGIALLVVLVGINLSGLFEVTELREQTFDAFARIKPRLYNPEDKVRIVDIDEQSLEAYGQWPWSRTLMGKLFSQLENYQVKIVGVDGIFPEYDRSSAVEILNSYEQDISPQVREEIIALPRTEIAMAKAMQDLPVVMGLVGFNQGNGAQVDSFDPSNTPIRSWFEPFPKKHLNYFSHLKGSVAEIQDAAAGAGIFSLQLDQNIYRQAPLLVNVANTYLYPSLSLEMLRLAMGGQSIALNNPQNLISGVTIYGEDQTLSIPSNPRGQIRIYFTRPQPYNNAPNIASRYISAKNILEGTAPKELLEDTFILIGSSSTGLKDLRSTPISPALPGVEIHANMIENIVSGLYLKESDNIRVYEFAVILIGGFFLIVLTSTAPYLLSLLTSALLIAGNSYLGWYLFDQHQILYDPVFSSVSFFLLFSFSIMLSFLRETREKSYIRQAFQRYISPDLVKQLTRSKKQLSLGGEKRNLTILFTDIRGFTTISEKLKHSPQLLTTVINHFLTPVTDIIINEQGTIDKYIGDCVMAFWNAPLQYDNHPSLAIRAALKIRDELTHINKKVQDLLDKHLDQPSSIKINAGLGINTGEVVVGNMGSERRFDYSVLGDSVNLASRLEGQTGVYHVDIIIGEETYIALPANTFQSLELDLISVKGKHEAVRIYTVLGESDERTNGNSWRRYQEQHAYFLKLYRIQQWEEAIYHLRQAQKNGPELMTNYYEAMMRRIELFQRSPPPSNWDGVFTARSK